MAKLKMTDRWVSAYCPVAKRAEIGDALCPGLYLRASTSTKSWSVVLRAGEKVQRVQIGRYPLVSLAEARNEALRLQRLAAQGGNLRAEAAAAKRTASLLAAAGAVTFGDVVHAYVERVTRTAKSWKNIKSALHRPELQPLHPRPMTGISKRELVAIIDSIAACGTPHAARNLLRNMQSALSFAVTRDLIQHNILDKVTPPVPPVLRDRVLSHDELRRVWHAAGTLQPQWEAMIKLMILTGQRRTECGKMRYEELTDDTWTIPRERTKKDRAQHVHLAPAAVALIAALPRPKSGVGFVFSGDGGRTASSYFSHAKKLLDQAAQLNEPFRFHDLRRTMRSGLAELGVAEPVSRKMMNHASGRIDTVYNRYSYRDETAKAWQDWAEFVSSIAA